MTQTETQELWSRIACPTLLVYGKESWASNPEDDGRIKHFKDARVVSFEHAGRWVHHDRLDGFLDLLREFLASKVDRPASRRNFNPGRKSDTAPGPRP